MDVLNVSGRLGMSQKVLDKTKKQEDYINSKTRATEMFPDTVPLEKGSSSRMPCG